MERKTCIRGQVLAKEGKPCNQIFILYQGEFEQYKSFPVEKENAPFTPEGHLPKYVLQEKRIKQGKITVLGKGSLFGEEGIVTEANYSSTLVCSLNNSVVLVFNRGDVEKVFQSKDREVQQEVIDLAKLKEETSYTKCENWTEMNKMN